MVIFFNGMLRPLFFDESEEWLIYLSHENTISFTGEKL